jgi:hypothetical protein
MKKIIKNMFLFIFLLSFISAQTYTLEIVPLKETYSQGEAISLKINLYDENKKLVSDEIEVILQDASKTSRVEKKIISNKIQEISLGEKASYGEGTITANYKDSTATEIFFIDINELVKFEIRDNNLLITNIGNTKYTKTVQITIGTTTGIKYPKLDPGKSVTYKLVAPEGTYSIKVSDGTTTITENNIKLTGTGQVVAAIDQTTTSRTSLTGTIAPEEDSEEALLSYMKNSKLTYTFILAIFGAMVLLAIERKYTKKANK